MGELAVHSSVSVNSFVGHRWEVWLEPEPAAGSGTAGRVVRRWTLGRASEQRLELEPVDLQEESWKQESEL